MVETVSDGGAAQLVTSAKAAVSQPTPSTEAFVSDCEQESFSEPSMLSPGSPLATVDSEPAAQQQDTAQSLSGKSSKARRDEQLKPCISSPSSRGGSEREREQPVVPKRGQRKPWRYPGLHTSSSYRQLTTVGGCHQYTISGYALARSLGPGTRMCSDLFEAGGQQFRLEVYLAGVSADAARHVSVFLTTPASINPNHLIYEIAVLDQSGRNRHLVHSSKPQQGPSLMPLSGVMAGYPCFVRHALLEKHARRYLLNDCLIVRATVEIVRSWSATPQQLAAPGSMAISTSPYSQPLVPDFSSYHGHCSSITAPAAGMHAAALHAPMVATVVQPAAVAHAGAAAAAAGRSDVSLHCSCPTCQVSRCFASAPGYSPHAGAAAAAAAEDGSSCARDAGAQSPAAAINAVNTQYRNHSSSPAASPTGMQAAGSLPAAAAAQQSCTCIACLTAQLQQLQHALGLQPSGSPAKSHLGQVGPADQCGSYSPPAAAGCAAQLNHTRVDQVPAVMPTQAVQYCSPVRAGAPSQVVYLASPQESAAAAAAGMYASPVFLSPQQQQPPQYVQPATAPYAAYYSSYSSPQRHGGSQPQYSSRGVNYMQAGPTPHAGVVDVQELGSEAGLSIPVAWNHPVRVHYS